MDIIRNLGAKNKKFYLSDIPSVLNPVTKNFFFATTLHTLSGRTGIHKRLALSFFVQTLRQ